MSNTSPVEIPAVLMRAWQAELERLRLAGAPVDAQVEEQVLQALLDREPNAPSHKGARVRTTTVLRLTDASLGTQRDAPPDGEPPPTPQVLSAAPEPRERPAPAVDPPAPVLRLGLGRGPEALRFEPDLLGASPPRPADEDTGELSFMDDAFGGLHSLSDAELADIMQDLGSTAGERTYDPEDASLWQTLFDVDPKMASRAPSVVSDPRPTNPGVSLDDLQVPNRETTGEATDPSDDTDTQRLNRRGFEIDPNLVTGEGLSRGPRYEAAGEVRSGAQGQVRAFVDRDLGRTVILKRLHTASQSDAAKVDQFLAEAKLTAQLEHPHIVPVYDVGRLEDGSIYYTMRLIEGAPLSQVIEQARAGDAAALERLNLASCVNLILQLSRALHYAHRRGVIHRDLKTENVMLTPHDDAMLMDWGLAKIVARSADSFEDTQDLVLENPRRYQTTVGTVKGTPAYMAPEQALGRVNLVDARTDIYSLGAILYELLTLHPPFSGRTIREVLGLLMVEAPVPPRQRCPERGIPQRIEALCLRCLEKDPEDRYQSARELELDLANFIDGGQLHLRAESLFVEGRARLDHMEAALKGTDAAVRVLSELRTRLRASGDASTELRRAVWAAQDNLDALDSRVQQDRAAAERALTSCLACLPSHEDARLKLDRLYVGEETAGIAGGDHNRTASARMKRQALGSGPRVEASGLISLSPSPPAAQLSLARFEERDRVLVPVEQPLPTGGLPVRMPLSEGSYVFTVRYMGHEPVTYPVFIEPGRHWKGFVQLATQGSVGVDFVQIPAGPVRLGGGGRSHSAAPTPNAQERRFNELGWLPTYYMGKEPVTLGEYAVFLQDLDRRGEDSAPYVPQVAGHGPLLIREAGGWSACLAELMHDPGADATALPIVGVTFAQASAYCKWRSSVTRVPHRLPTEQEWEKASRGVDGRRYPWGDRFDASHCHLAGATGNPGLRPVGACSIDASVYGVLDSAGGVREWCQRPGGETQRLMPTRGSSWMDGESMAPLWLGRLALASEGRADVGFRLVRELASTPRKDRG